MFNVGDSFAVVAARDIVRAAVRAVVAVRDVVGRVAVRDLVATRDVVGRVAARDTTDWARRVSVVAVVRGVTVAVVATREATFLGAVVVRVSFMVVARSRDVVVIVRPVVVPDAPFVEDCWTAFMPRDEFPVETFCAVARDAARTTSSYSRPGAPRKASTPRHTPKSSLRFFIPFVYRLAKL